MDRAVSAKLVFCGTFNDCSEHRGWIAWAERAKPFHRNADEVHVAWSFACKPPFRQWSWHVDEEFDVAAQGFR